MPKKPDDLTALEVKALKEPGTHRVSANLYLQVTASVAADSAPGSVVRSWLYRYQTQAGDKRQRWDLDHTPLSRSPRRAVASQSIRTNAATG